MDSIFRERERKKELFGAGKIRLVQGQEKATAMSIILLSYFLSRQRTRHRETTQGQKRMCWSGIQTSMALVPWGNSQK